MNYLSLIGYILTFVNSAAVNEPPNGKVYLSAWLDTTAPDNNPNNFHTGDRPWLFNSRLNTNISVFQYAQNFPNPGDPQYMQDQLNALNDDALLYISVYPIVARPHDPSDWTFTDNDITQLVQQCASLNRQGRKVLIRFGPEMNGYWMAFGNAPTKFIPLWRKVYTAIKAEAPMTDMVWAPNAGNGWPWGVQRSEIPTRDFELMDTNRNGILDSGDDPYAPFWPGDEYVDWIGASNYHFGTTPPYYENTLPYLGEFEANINAYDLYQRYGPGKNKPFLIAETGAAFHPREPVGPGELPIKQAWWRQTITNSTFLDTYSQIKLICMFEFIKIEGDNNNDLRDFRVSFNPDVASAFIQDFAAVKNRYYTTVYKPRIVIKNPPSVGALPAAGKPSSNSEWVNSMWTSFLVFLGVNAL